MLQDLLQENEENSTSTTSRSAAFVGRSLVRTVRSGNYSTNSSQPEKGSLWVVLSKLTWGMGVIDRFTDFMTTKNVNQMIGNSFSYS